MSLNVTDFFDDWNKSHTSSPSFQDAIDWAKKKVIYEACEQFRNITESVVHPQSVHVLVDKFRKVMEK